MCAEVIKRRAVAPGTPMLNRWAVVYGPGNRAASKCNSVHLWSQCEAVPRRIAVPWTSRNLSRGRCTTEVVRNARGTPITLPRSWTPGARWSFPVVLRADALRPGDPTDTCQISCERRDQPPWCTPCSAYSCLSIGIAVLACRVRVGSKCLRLRICLFGRISLVDRVPRSVVHRKNSTHTKFTCLTGGEFWHDTDKLSLVGIVGKHLLNVLVCVFENAHQFATCCPPFRSQPLSLLSSFESPSLSEFLQNKIR